MPDSNTSSESIASLKLATSAKLAFLYGNTVIGVGVMIVPGMLNQLAQDLHVSIPVGGQLISIGAVVMALGAPIIAASTSPIDRRLLLTISQLIYMVGALLCAIAPQFAALLPLRALAVIGAAIFTPQAAATIGLLVPAEKRSAAVTTIFMGWSIAAVIAMPLGSLIAAHLGWRYGFVLLAIMALISSIWIWRVVPSGLTVPKLSLASWQQVATSKKLLLILSVTLLSSTGQFTVLAYVAPYLLHQVNASPVQFSLLMVLNGLAGIAGALWVTRTVGRRGAEKTVNNASTVLMIGLAIWALQTQLPSITLASHPPSEIQIFLAWAMLATGSLFWGAGSFATNATQQARLAGVAPSLASASISLNTSAMYSGQSLGAVIGALILTSAGYAVLPWVATALLICAWIVSKLAGRVS